MVRQHTLMRGGLAVLAGLVALVLFWPGTTTELPVLPPGPTGIPQGHVYTGVADEPRWLNPFVTVEAVARRYVLGFTHDTLLDTDPQTGALRPALAAAWHLHPDGLTVDFDLRDGVVFADGAPMRPEDVLFTWEVARTPDLVLGTLREGLDLVERAELLPGAPARLRVVLRQRHFAAVQAVGESWIVTQRAYWLRRIAELAAGEAVPAPGAPGFGALLSRIEAETGPGTGPFRLAGEADGRPGWRLRNDLLLVRAESSWRRAARPGTWNLGAVRLLFRDKTAAYNALVAGEIDWYAFPDADAIAADQPQVRERCRYLVYDTRNLGVQMVLWNCRRGPTADARVRLALGLLFRRDDLASRLLRGCGRPAAAFGRIGTPEYPADLAPLPFDPARARTLLREAGFDAAAGKPLRLEILAQNGLARQMVDALADAAKDVGVEIAARVLDANAIQAAVERREFDGAVRGQGFRNWIDPYDQFHGKGGLNSHGLADPQVDSLLERARVELDDQARAELYRQCHRRLAELQPVAFLVHPLAPVLLDARIQDAEPGPLGLWPERFWVRYPDQRR